MHSTEAAPRATDSRGKGQVHGRLQTQRKYLLPLLLLLLLCCVDLAVHLSAWQASVRARAPARRWPQARPHLQDQRALPAGGVPKP